LRWQEDQQRFLCEVILDAQPEDKERLKEKMAMETGCSSSLCNTQRNAFLSSKGKEYLIQVLNWPFNS
jgi:hypothetical protein